MAIVNTVDLIATAVIGPQRDGRDPLGVWGVRTIVTGDATGGTTKVIVQVPAVIAGAYVYTCYSVNASPIGISTSGQLFKVRLLTNWPDMDAGLVGVQGYSTHRQAVLLGSANFTPPNSGPGSNMLSPNDRFLLLFDPRITQGSFSLVEMEIDVNTDTQDMAFECWGYYWDRGVLQIAGGLRHPGAD